MDGLGVAIALLVTLWCYGLTQTHNTTENPDCFCNSQCTSEQACVNNKCTDPCLNACGLNTVCHIVNHMPMCSCKTGYNGHPFTNCNPGLEPQCTMNAHCNKDKACLNQQCVDLCVGVCGANTECKAVDHYPVCSCSPGFVWNPLSGCVPNIIPECISNTQCAAKHICVNQKCVDPCDGVCGNNTVCHVNNHYPACACKSGYSGDPFHECTPQCSEIQSVTGDDKIIYRKSKLIDMLSKKKFFISSNKATWNEAVAGCHDRDMTLASIESQKEQDDMETQIKISGIDDNLLVSGTDFCEPGKYIWPSTGRSPQYSNWASGSPTAKAGMNCIKIRKASADNPFEWYSANCTYPAGFVCQYHTI